MLFVACCWLVVAGDSCSLLSVGRCALSGACCVLFVAVCCLLVVVVCRVSYVS